MDRSKTTIIGGVDTHAATHHAAVIDSHGRLLADSEFPASPSGYSAMLTWMRSLGSLTQVGVEGTGAYGAGLARYLHDHAVEVLEVPRPDRRIRRQRGKSDPIDAEAAARTVLAGKASGAPKLADGPIEAIRMLRVARLGAVKARTAAINTLRAILITAPDSLRTQLQGLSPAQLMTACARLRPDPTQLADPAQATKAALRSLAIRAQHLELETRTLRKQLKELTQTVAPATSAVFGLGPDTVSALLVTIGDNPDRLRREAAFAHLCGVAPIPASSGKTNRHRLHRGGDRTGNSALHIATVVRLRYDSRGRVYAERRTGQGLSMPESSAARSVTSPASSTPYAPTTPNSALDIYRSVLCNLPQGVLLQLGLGQQPLESSVLFTQFLELLGGVGVHPTVGAAPVVQRRRRHLQLGGDLLASLACCGQLVRAAQLAHNVLRGMPLPTSHVIHRPFQPTNGATGL
jgi:transposase